MCKIVKFFAKGLPARPKNKDGEAIDAGPADRHGEFRARAPDGGGAQRLRSAPHRAERPADRGRRQRPRARHARGDRHPADRRGIPRDRSPRLRFDLRQRQRPVSGHHPARRRGVGAGLGERRQRASGRRRPEGDASRGDPGRSVRRHLRALCRPPQGRGPHPGPAPAGDHRKPHAADARPPGRGASASPATAPRSA